ncbi:MAG: hypothetical protein HDR02_07745 [Lachnospiraceae bacterium]|nr:hypothetical protein [Lachnospiraceae bacterium]
MLKIRGTKWITRFLVLALAGGVMVTATACGTGDRKTGDSQESAGKPLESGEQDYSGLAARIDEGAVAYLEAMKAGDIETILSMTDPESKIYKKLSGIKEYETGKEFISTLYGSIVYEWQEDRDTEYDIAHAIEQDRDYFYLDMYVGIPDTIYFTQYLTVPGVLFQDGELIPEGYEVKSNEEALQIVRSMAELFPLADTAITVELQEDGGFYFEVTAPFSCMDDSDFESGENFLPEFLSEKISDGVIVGESDKLYEENQEEWVQILSLLKQKDFDGLFALASGEPDKYIKRQNSFKTPEELTETQRDFYDSYIEQIEVFISEKTYGEPSRFSMSVMIVAPATSLNDQEMEWYNENGIKENTIDFWFGEEDLDDAMSTLLLPLKHGIEYAEKKY